MVFCILVVPRRRAADLDALHRQLHPRVQGHRPPAQGRPKRNHQHRHHLPRPLRRPENGRLRSTAMHHFLNPRHARHPAARHHRLLRRHRQRRAHGQAHEPLQQEQDQPAHRFRRRLRRADGRPRLPGRRPANTIPTTILLMHAMGPNVAGVIGSALAAGYFLSMLK